MGCGVITCFSNKKPSAMELLNFSKLDAKLDIVYVNAACPFAPVCLPRSFLCQAPVVHNETTCHPMTSSSSTFFLVSTQNTIKILPSLLERWLTLGRILIFLSFLFQVITFRPILTYGILWSVSQTHKVSCFKPTVKLLGCRRTAPDFFHTVRNR